MATSGLEAWAFAAASPSLVRSEIRSRSMPCVVVLRGELGNRFGPWEHIARELPEVSIA